MANSQDMAAQAGTQPAEPDQDDQKGSPVSVIEVSVYQDGTLEVEVETGAQESAEQSGGGESAGAAPTQVKDKAEALQVVSSAIDAALQPQQENSLQEQQQGYSGG